MYRLSDTTKTGLQLAKQFWSEMSNSRTLAFVEIAPSDSNLFAEIYKSDNAGRLVLHGVTSGQTTVYKKGYNDDDFVIVS